MKKFFALILCVAMVFSTMSAFAYESDAFTIKIDLADKSPFGAFEGWGTSLCWWGYHLGTNLEADEIDEVAKSLYSYDEGLGLNIARFNIGGGDDPEHHHQREFDGRNMPGFLDAEGNWDFTADQGQIDMLNACIKYGADNLEAFSNSPPYFMTQSGCSSGGKDPNVDNLPKENYPEFANYLATVVKYLHDTYNIDFDTLEPFNESGTDFWGYEGWQEGCHFDSENHSELILACRQALDELGLSTVSVAAADAHSIAKMGENLDVYTDEAIDVLERVNAHSYYVGNYDKLKNAALEVGKKLYMTEFDGDGSVKGNSGEMGPAVWFSQKITEDLRGLEANGWVMWQAMAMSYPNNHRDSGYWNIAGYNQETKEVEKYKKYYAYMQFTKFIRPGDTLVLTNTANALAAVNEDEGKLTYVITNSTQDDRKYNALLSNLNMTNESVKFYITDKEHNCQEINLGSIDGFTVPAYSIVSVVINAPIEGESISLSSQNGVRGALVGDSISFNVSDELGENVSANLSLSSDAPAQIIDNAVTLTGSGNFTVYANYNGKVDSLPLSSADYGNLVRIVGQESGRALSAVNERIYLAETGYEASQMWLMEKDGENVTFRNDRTGEYLSCENGLTTGEKNEYALWKMEWQDGSYTLVATTSGKSLDVYNHASFIGAPVGLYDATGGANQKWYFDQTAPKTAIEINYTAEEIVLSGEPFGTDSWVGNAEVSFDKAWDGNFDTFFDAATGSEGYTGIDLGSKHIGFNKILVGARLGFETRLVGAKLMGANEENGEYELIHEFTQEDIKGEVSAIELDRLADYRFVKYVSPENGYCNVSEIQLIHSPYNVSATIEDTLSINLGNKIPMGDEKYVIGYYDNFKLVKTSVVKDGVKEELKKAFDAKEDISIDVVGKNSEMLLKLFVKKY